MDTVDVNQEWRKLQELYSAMTEDELQVIADDGYELTEIARQALQAEISSRGLSIGLAQPSPTVTDSPDEDSENSSADDGADLELIEFDRVWTLEEAVKLKRTLDLGGIPVFFGPELVEDAETVRGSFEGGVDVRIRDFDQQRAYAVLAHADSLSPADPRESQPEEIDCVAHCPKCHSDEIVFQSLDPASLPNQSAFDSKFNWHCDACGCDWKDDGIESEA